jgi:hypothetical protein
VRSCRAKSRSWALIARISSLKLMRGTEILAEIAPQRDGFSSITIFILGYLGYRCIEACYLRHH